MKFETRVYKILKQEFPLIEPPLHFNAPHELAIAVILSAQCTDEQVNKVTPGLFARFPNLKELAKAPLNEIEKLIYSTGFYKNKAKNISGFSKMLLENFHGNIPKNLETLMSMPGVGRKTANVILQILYGIAEGIVVDTHVLRISRLLGFTSSKNPNKVEADLMKQLPRNYWLDWSLMIIFLGRKYCNARKPNCIACPLGKICPSSSR